MKQYLIIRCDELGDQWECDAERSPMTLTSDWERWFFDNRPTYQFEVYEFNGKDFNLVKGYDA